MPSPTSSRLTLAPGARLKGGFKGRWAAERIISDTTLSLLKPASYAGARAFSRAFVSRLRHRAGVVRRETRREGCVRDKQKAQKPTIAPKGGAEANETAAKDPQVAGLQTTRAAQTPPLKRTLPRAGANEKTKRTRRRRTAKIFATKRQRYHAWENRNSAFCRRHPQTKTFRQNKRPDCCTERFFCYLCLDDSPACGLFALLHVKTTNFQMSRRRCKDAPRVVGPRPGNERF